MEEYVIKNGRGKLRLSAVFLFKQTYHGRALEVKIFLKK
ncbi:hypothetical protein BH5_01040 [Bacillus subtilis]|nr:hypothetical protein BH5_01040 [Bacillus subtilis]